MVSGGWRDGEQRDVITLNMHHPQRGHLYKSSHAKSSRFFPVNQMSGNPY